MSTIGTAAIDPKSQDYSAAVNQVKPLKPDVMFYGGYYEQAGRLKKQLTDARRDAPRSSAVTARSTPGFVEGRRARPPTAPCSSCPCYFASDVSPGKIGEFAKAYKDAQRHGARHLLDRGLRRRQHPHRRASRPATPTRPKLLDYVEGLT